MEPINGITLSIDYSSGEDAEQLKQWLEPILNTVNANAFKNVADEIDLSQQMCKLLG